MPHLTTISHLGSLHGKGETLFCWIVHIWMKYLITLRFVNAKASNLINIPLFSAYVWQLYLWLSKSIFYHLTSLAQVTRQSLSSIRCPQRSQHHRRYLYARTLNISRTLTMNPCLFDENLPLVDMAPKTDVWGENTDLLVVCCHQRSSFINHGLLIDFKDTCHETDPM